MPVSDRIDLAREAVFQLGELTLHPPLRQIVRADGASEVVEPRVMQVLIALARADGGIVARNELTRCCWDDRIVGEDAINRVISRLRRVADGIGAGSFRIETVTKVGYRLARPGDALPAAAHSKLNRRAVIAGAATAALAALGGATLWLRRPDDDARVAAAAPEDVAPLMAQAAVALKQATREGQNQAIGLYRRVVALRPDYADGWGALGVAYAITSHYRATDEFRTLSGRA